MAENLANQEEKILRKVLIPSDISKRFAEIGGFQGWLLSRELKGILYVEYLVVVSTDAITNQFSLPTNPSSELRKFA